LPEHIVQIIKMGIVPELILGQKGNSFDSEMRGNDAYFQAESSAAISRLPFYRKAMNGKKGIRGTQRPLPKAPTFISGGTAESPD
jgi:hypothetical protein